MPSNVSLAHLPPYSPELNPVERVGLHLKESYAAHRVVADVPAIVDACATAWNLLLAEKGRLAGLAADPCLKQVGIS